MPINLILLGIPPLATFVLLDSTTTDSSWTYDDPKPIRRESHEGDTMKIT